MNPTTHTQPGKDLPNQKNRPNQSAEGFRGSDQSVQPGYDRGKQDDYQVTGRGDKRDQLRSRFDSRIGDLERAFSQEKDPKGERAMSLQKEIKSGRDFISGGWDRMGEADEARVGQWLENNQYLTQGGKNLQGGQTGKPGTVIEQGRPEQDTAKKSPPGAKS
jgi:hypothetical protein